MHEMRRIITLIESTHTQGLLEAMTPAQKVKLAQFQNALEDALAVYDADKTPENLEKVTAARRAADYYFIHQDGVTDPAERFSLPDDDKRRSPYHHGYKPRGGFTLDKIRARLKQTASLSSRTSLSQLFNEKGASSLAKEIRRFSSAEEFADHLYWHGTGGYVSGGLRAGVAMPASTEFGGGSGQAYYVISVSRDKDIASNFTGQSRFGTVHPVIVRKGAKVISLPGLSDANELDDLLPELWQRGVDAVKLGDWDDGNSEQELAIVNPRAVIIGRGESFQVFQKAKQVNPTGDEIATVYRAAFDVPNKPTS